ncbi:MAG: ABC transporter substrate-binding protein [Candidatus Staskawiczbacteria bacterium]|jgi:ABC-type transport system substrate-binding protein
MKQIRFPKFSQWKRIFKILHKKEKIAFSTLLALAGISFIVLFTSIYINNTIVVPKSGGSFIEGAVGQPRFLNPIYGETSDIDRDLTELIFSGLMTYDNNGQIITDLVEEYKISEDGRTYEFKLKPNILWHDGESLTSDDVIFTIQTIQNSDYKSPIRANWLDVETEKISGTSFKLRLKSPYNSFLENCTLKIIPKHVWENILPENFALSFYNLQPIGSGPYKFKGLKQTDAGFIKSIVLTSNQNYYKQPAFISEISFNFYEKKENLLSAVNRREIHSFSSSYLSDQSSAPKSFVLHSMETPRYFSVFLNIANSDIVSDKKIREALNYATDKKGIVDALNASFSKKYNADPFHTIESPILPGFFGYASPESTYAFDLEKAKEIFDKAGFKENEQGLREKSINKKPAFQFKSSLSVGSKGSEVEELQKCLAKDPEIYTGDATGYFGNATKEGVTKFQKKYLPDLAAKSIGSVGKSTITKLNELCTPPAQSTLPLKVVITTVNQPSLTQVADILKSQWAKVGVTVEVNVLSISDLKSVIKDRSYESLLYGEALGMLFDPYPFWHSSQIIDPGLNLTGYENAAADKLLKAGRETLDEAEKKETYESFQEILLSDAPAVFLYSSDYLYLANKKTKGIDAIKIVDPAKRFSNVEDWYIKTKRIWR